jgi:hypothetical protein
MQKLKENKSLTDMVGGLQPNAYLLLSPGLSGLTPVWFTAALGY